MLMEQGFYAPVVMLSRKYSIFNYANKNKNEAKFKFQGQSASSQSWFDLDFDLNKISLITRETDLYKKLFQSHDNTQDTNKFKIVLVPTGN